MRQTFTTQLETKSLSDNGTFTGYASVFGIKDHDGDIIQKGAFTKSLDSWKEKNSFPSLLWQHNQKEPIGIYTRMEEDTKGLYVEGQLLVEDDPLAKRAYGHLKAGSISGLSIGYISTDIEQFNDAIVIKELDLWEVSLVTFPANEQSRIRDVKRALMNNELPTKVEVERSLREVGFSIRQAKSLIAGGYNFLNPRQADADIEETDVKNLINILRG